MYTPARIGVIFAVLAVMLTIYVSGLYVIQIHDPMMLDENQAPVRRITRRTTLHAARGNIYDRNGVLLASGRPSYDIKIDRLALLASQRPNEIVQELIYAAMDEGMTYTDTFPVTRGAPFEFLTNMSATQRSRLDAYLEYYNLDPEISVSDLLAWMRNNYSIDFTVGILDARLIIGVRYELEVRAIVHSITPYIFSSDVDTDFIAFIEERRLSGVYPESTFVREYHTSSAPHLIGYIGRMTAEEYERYKELGYPMDASVGKIGSELAFEEILHGSSGEQITRFAPDGTVLGVEVIREPIPGDHVTLTLDLDLQIVTEHALRTQIEGINLERERERLNNDDDEEDDNLITGGAVVVQNVNTGEILAAATFPSFNLQTLTQDWLTLNTDPNNPMLNRATHGRYMPGSTYKMVTALAALRNIPRISNNYYYPIRDTGIFDDYADGGFIAHCWIYNRHRVGHGDTHLTTALEYSCNYYFLQVTDWLPGGHRVAAKTLAETAQEFGLGIRSGLEITEAAGSLATPESREELTGDTLWVVADTLLAGFGQGDNRFTPVQLANYVSTIANGGSLYSQSILRMVRSSSFQEVLHTHTPEVLSVIEETEYIDRIQAGMLAASRGRNGTATSVFGNYNPVVASKTGTVQIEGRAFNDGLFVCYAPAENPEIAISIVVEKGGSGSAIMRIARTIFEHYFVTESTFRAIPYGDLIP